MNGERLTAHATRAPLMGRRLDDGQLMSISNEWMQRWRLCESRIMKIRIDCNCNSDDLSELVWYRADIEDFLLGLAAIMNRQSAD